MSRDSRVPQRTPTRQAAPSRLDGGSSGRGWRRWRRSGEEAPPGGKASEDGGPGAGRAATAEPGSPGPQHSPISVFRHWPEAVSQIRLQSENDSSNSRCGWAASYLLRLSSQHVASMPRLPVPRHPHTLQGPDWALHAQATRVGSSSTASSRAGEMAREKKTVPFPAAASLFLPLPCSFSTRYPADHTAGNHGPSHVCFVPRGGPRDKPAAGSHTQHPLPECAPCCRQGAW